MTNDFSRFSRCRIWEGEGGGGGATERQRDGTYTGGETDTYIWSQQGSPEICFCAGASRVCSQALCRLKTRPDQEGCPGPCLKDRVRWTQSGGGGDGVCGWGGWGVWVGGDGSQQLCSSTGSDFHRV